MGQLSLQCDGLLAGKPLDSKATFGMSYSPFLRGLSSRSSTPWWSFLVGFVATAYLAGINLQSCSSRGSSNSFHSRATRSTSRSHEEVNARRGKGDVCILLLPHSHGVEPERMSYHDLPSFDVSLFDGKTKGQG